VTVVFLAGLIVRVSAFTVPREIGPQTVPVSRWRPSAFTRSLENDEQIFLALTEQLDAGRGYNLRGHPILNQPWLAADQYGQALFFHPPGGIALFWIFHRVAGEAGPALAQLFCFVIFFWSVMLLGNTMLKPADGEISVDAPTMALLAVSAAFTPIMAHVAGRLWLDGPQLAFSTAAWAVFALGWARRKTWIVCASGVLLGYACLIKLNAFLIVASVVAAGWAVTPREDRRRFVLACLLFVVIGVLVELPWNLWQWHLLGSPFPAWAGKPTALLVKSNRYVYYLTVIRPSWIYLELLPQVIWTAVPSLVLLGFEWRNRSVRALGLALVVGIAAVVGADIVLGAIGYSKVLRYAILITPAASLLFALVTGARFRLWRDTRPVPGGKPMVAALVVLAMAGLTAEVAQSLKTTFVDNAQIDLIQPLTGFRDLK
jgi:4-amino-4-deoxy-L-arabinose transferase-like glycosyltransferase